MVVDSLQSADRVHNSQFTKYGAARFTSSPSYFRGIARASKWASHHLEVSSATKMAILPRLGRSLLTNFAIYGSRKASRRVSVDQYDAPRSWLCSGSIFDVNGRFWEKRKRWFVVRDWREAAMLLPYVIGGTPARRRISIGGVKLVIRMAVMVVLFVPPAQRWWKYCRARHGHIENDESGLWKWRGPFLLLRLTLL